MKKIDLSAVSTTNGMPIKSGTIDHLQSSYQEAISSIVKNIITGSSYNSTKGYVLHGCINTGTGSNYVISAGAVFFNGEVYQVPAATFTISGTNVAVGSIQTTYFSATNADPVTFTDSVNRNVHQIRQIVFASGLSGSGAFDYSNAIFVQLVHVDEVLTKTNVDSYTPSNDYNPATKKYVDDRTPLVIKAFGSVNVGTVPQTPSYYGTVSIGLTLPNTNYYVMGMIYINGTIGYGKNCNLTIYGKTTTTFEFAVDSYNGTAYNVVVEWILYQA